MKKPTSYLLDDVGDHTDRPTKRAILTGGGYIAAVLVTAAVGAGAYAGGMFNTPPPIDPKTGCRLDMKSDISTNVLIDITDPLSAIHAERLRERLKAVSKSLPDYSRFAVFVLNPDDPSNPQELFRRCAPRSPDRASTVDSGSEYLRHQWDQKFETPLLASVESLTESTIHAKRSPILATIAGLTQRPDFDSEVPNRTLVVISDMVEHDDRPGGYSHMRKSNLITDFQRSPYANTLHADLGRTTVIVDYLLRPEYASFQNDKHLRFWRWWFTDAANAKELVFLGVKEPTLATINSKSASAQPGQSTKPPRP